MKIISRTLLLQNSVWVSSLIARFSYGRKSNLKHWWAEGNERWTPHSATRWINMNVDIKENTFVLTPNKRIFTPNYVQYSSWITVLFHFQNNIPLAIQSSSIVHIDKLLKITCSSNNFDRFSKLREEHSFLTPPNTKHYHFTVSVSLSSMLKVFLGQPKFVAFGNSKMDPFFIINTSYQHLSISRTDTEKASFRSLAESCHGCFCGTTFSMREKAVVPSRVHLLIWVAEKPIFLTLQQNATLVRTQPYLRYVTKLLN